MYCMDNRIGQYAMSWQDSQIIVLSIGFICLTITFIIWERERESERENLTSTLYIQLNRGRTTEWNNFVLENSCTGIALPRSRVTFCYDAAPQPLCSINDYTWIF